MLKLISSSAAVSLDIALRALFGCIAYHSEVQTELVRQLDGWQLGDSPPPLALSTVIETIRLFPERPISHPFILGQDIMLRGYDVEKGTKLFVLNCRANTSKHGGWDPIGALDEGQGENMRPRWTFGFGRRRCPAMHFAVPATAMCEYALLPRRTHLTYAAAPSQTSAPCSAATKSTLPTNSTVAK